MKLILLGAPGAGKGTQAEIISKKLEIPTISTGNILRAAVKDGTPVGLKAKALIEAGALVPDDIIIGIVAERLAQDDCKNGYILDGYPRNLAQAEGLEAITGPLDKVVCIEVEDGIIVDRMTGRRSCPKCNAMFHTKYNPPKVEGVCDVCGEKLIQRKDDNEETVVNRLKIYHDTTAPLIDFYGKKGILATVNGVGDIDEIFAEVCKALEA
jgi:adenylate kinase